MGVCVCGVVMWMCVCVVCVVCGVCVDVCGVCVDVCVVWLCKCGGWCVCVCMHVCGGCADSIGCTVIHFSCTSESSQVAPVLNQPESLLQGPLMK